MNNKPRWGGPATGGTKTNSFKLPLPKHDGNQAAWDRLKEKLDAAGSENFERTLSKAIKSLAACKTAVVTYQDAMALVGVGKFCASIIVPVPEDNDDVGGGGGEAGGEGASMVARPSKKAKPSKKVAASAGDSGDAGPSAKESKYQTAKQNAMEKWTHPIRQQGLVWKVLLIVDAREPKHEHIVSKCSMSGIPAESRTLPIGDMTWIAQGLRKHKVCGETTMTVEVELLLGTIIERKTTEDLVSSLFGTRYEEQRLRLKHSGQPQVLFLIEGNIQRDVHPKFPKERLQMALLETRVEMGFQITFTTHMDATVQALKRFHRRILQRSFPEAFGLADDALPSFSSPGASHSRQQQQIERQQPPGADGASANRRRRRRPASLVEMVLDTPPVPAFGESRFMTYSELKFKIERDREAGTRTVGAIHAAMLRQVCGKQKIKAILLTYPTPASLLQAYDDVEGGNPKQKSELVAGCIDTNAVDGGGNRRVGPNASQDLYMAYCTTNAPKTTTATSTTSISSANDVAKKTATTSTNPYANNTSTSSSSAVVKRLSAVENVEQQREPEAVEPLAKKLKRLEAVIDREALNALAPTSTTLVVARASISTSLPKVSAVVKPATAVETTATVKELCPLLASFQLYGWKPLPELSIDDNLLDLLLLVTRNSVCHAAGHMGCIFTRPMTTPGASTSVSCDTSSLLMSRNQPLLDSILAVANNQPLYAANTSDVHAEVTAIGRCAKAGTSTNGCTAYITMPPCKNCLGALVMAGVKRIVFLRSTLKYITDISEKFNLQVSGFQESSERRVRVEAYVSRYNKEHNIDGQAEVERLRLQRKLDKQERQKNRKGILLTKKNIHPSQLGPSYANASKSALTAEHEVICLD